MTGTSTVEVSLKGMPVLAPVRQVGQRLIICGGKWVRVARIHDEDWCEGQPVEDPQGFVAALGPAGVRADVFTFSQALPETQPKYSYHFEWENLAVAPTSDFAAWWESLPQESRKNVRRAERRGVVVMPVSLDDNLTLGIKAIYDETPVRQGRRFWHYGKEESAIRRQNASYLDRSQFIAAVHGDELIGFLKMVYAGRTARIMQILSKNKHFDKRPTNALLAKAVEICSQRGVLSLIYGQYIYGKKSDSPVTEFKRRNGFEQVLLPRYFVPLNVKGKFAIAVGLHRSVRNLLPKWVVSPLLGVRQFIYRQICREATASCSR
jgi:hypothetical protein